MKVCPHKDLFMGVYSSFICNGLKTETTQVSISRRMDEQNVGHVYSRILVSRKKEQTIDNSNNMGESQSNYTAAKEAGGKKVQTL